MPMEWAVPSSSRENRRGGRQRESCSRKVFTTSRRSEPTGRPHRAFVIFDAAPRVDLRRYRSLRMFQPLIPEEQEASHGSQRLAQLPCRVTPSQQLKHYCARWGLD